MTPPFKLNDRSLRGAIYRKQMLYSQYTKNRSSKNWGKFRKQRNLVTKIKRKSMKVYSLERCSGGSKSCEFWKTVKHLFSEKGNCGEQTFVSFEMTKLLIIQMKSQIILILFSPQ